MRTGDGGHPETVEVRVKDGDFGHECGDEKSLRKIGSQGDSKVGERALDVLGQGLDSINILAQDLWKDSIVGTYPGGHGMLSGEDALVVRVMFDHVFERLKSLDKSFDLSPV